MIPIYYSEDVSKPLEKFCNLQIVNFSLLFKDKLSCCVIKLKLGLHYRLLASRGGTASGRSVNGEKVGEFATGRHPPRRRLGEVDTRWAARWGDAVAEVP